MVRRRQVRIARCVQVLQIVVIACLDVGQIASGETQSGPQNLPGRREPLP